MTQHAMRFIDNIGYHEYEGPATNLDERERLQRDLGDKCALMLRNHGLMSCGATIPHAFRLIEKLEKACQAQVDGMAAGTKMIEIAPTVQDHAKKQFKNQETKTADIGWAPLLRQLDRIDPSYKH